MPASKRTGQRKHPEPSVIRAVADELGITTPKKVRRRHKGPMRVAVYDANREQRTLGQKGKTVGRRKQQG